jgi:hypothetical protein
VHFRPIETGPFQTDHHAAAKRDRARAHILVERGAERRRAHAERGAERAERGARLVVLPFALLFGKELIVALSEVNPDRGVLPFPRASDQDQVSQVFLVYQVLNLHCPLNLVRASKRKSSLAVYLLPHGELFPSLAI